MSLVTAQMEGCILAPGLCLFGNNAYLNSIYMATPFAAISGGSKDAYNFYHSQLCIRIECVFGMLIHQWSILRCAIPMRISLKKKTIDLVTALVMLHNYWIDEKDSDVPTLCAVDEVRTELEGSVPLETTPTSTGRTVLLPRHLIDGVTILMTNLD